MKPLTLDYAKPPERAKTGSHFVAGPPSFFALVPVIGYLAKSEILFTAGLALTVAGTIFCAIGIIVSVIRKESVTRTWVCSFALNFGGLAGCIWLLKYGNQ